MESVGMTAAEFRLAREYLGVTGEWLAARLGVAARTVRRWEQGSAVVPVGAAGEVGALLAEQDAFVSALGGVSGWVVTFASDEDVERVHPGVGWSAGWHRAAVGRLVRLRPGVRVRFAGSGDG